MESVQISEKQIAVAHPQPGNVLSFKDPNSSETALQSQVASVRRQEIPDSLESVPLMASPVTDLHALLNQEHKASCTRLDLETERMEDCSPKQPHPMDGCSPKRTYVRAPTSARSATTNSASPNSPETEMKQSLRAPRGKKRKQRAKTPLQFDDKLQTVKQVVPEKGHAQSLQPVASQAARKGPVPNKAPSGSLKRGAPRSRAMPNKTRKLNKVKEEQTDSTSKTANINDLKNVAAENKRTGPAANTRSSIESKPLTFPAQIEVPLTSPSCALDTLPDREENQPLSPRPILEATHGSLLNCAEGAEAPPSRSNDLEVEEDTPSPPTQITTVFISSDCSSPGSCDSESSLDALEPQNVLRHRPQGGQSPPTGAVHTSEIPDPAAGGLCGVHSGVYDDSQDDRELPELMPSGAHNVKPVQQARGKTSCTEPPGRRPFSERSRNSQMQTQGTKSDLTLESYAGAKIRKQEQRLWKVENTDEPKDCQSTSSINNHSLLFQEVQGVRKGHQQKRECRNGRETQALRTLSISEDGSPVRLRRDNSGQLMSPVRPESLCSNEHDLDNVPSVLDNMAHPREVKRQLAFREPIVPSPATPRKETRQFYDLEVEAARHKKDRGWRQPLVTEGSYEGFKALPLLDEAQNTLDTEMGGFEDREFDTTGTAVDNKGRSRAIGDTHSKAIAEQLHGIVDVSCNERTGKIRHTNWEQVMVERLDNAAQAFDTTADAYKSGTVSCVQKIGRRFTKERGELEKVWKRDAGKFHRHVEKSEKAIHDHQDQQISMFVTSEKGWVERQELYSKASDSLRSFQRQFFDRGRSQRA